jgi:hypothetical protein
VTDEFFRRVGEKINVFKRRDELIGKILRSEVILKAIIEGRIQGNNCNGRPRLAYVQ